MELLKFKKNNKRAVQGFKERLIDEKQQNNNTWMLLFFWHFKSSILCTGCLFLVGFLWETLLISKIKTCRFHITVLLFCETKNAQNKFSIALLVCEIQGDFKILSGTISDDSFFL